MRKLLLLLLATSSLGSVAAPATDSTTKAEVPTLEAAWRPVVVDHIFGIRGGYGTGSMRREPAKETVAMYGFLNFGISYRIDIPEQLYVGCIEIDLQYMQKGFAFATVFDGDEVYSRQYSVIEVPILWQPYFPMGRKGRPTESRIFLNAGPYLAYALEGTERTYNRKTNETISERVYRYDALRDNRVEYGVVVGGGVVIGAGRLGIAVDFRYNIMLSDVLKGVQNYTGNPFRSPVDQMSLSLGFQYRFIKGKTKKQ